MPLVPLDLALAPAPLPAPIAALLADAGPRIEAFLAARPAGAHGYVPCDHELVFHALRELRSDPSIGSQLCEWGSGFGVVVGIAALLGFEATGIEVDRELVEASRRLLAVHARKATICVGSFVPEAYAAAESLSDLDTRTQLSARDAYGDMDLGIEDFDVVYAYPWPTEEEQYCDLFRRYASPGAVLVTFSAVEGVRAYRQSKRGRRADRRR